MSHNVLTLPDIVVMIAFVGRADKIATDRKQNTAKIELAT